MFEPGDKMFICGSNSPLLTPRDLTVKSIEQFTTSAGSGATNWGVRFEPRTRVRVVQPFRCPFPSFAPTRTEW